MRLFQTVLCAVAVALVGVAAPFALAAEDPAPAPPVDQVTTPPEPATDAGVENPDPDTSEQRSGKLWVCCDDGRERWTATNEVCKKRGGSLLPSRFCERPTYVCCKQGRAEWWMPSRDACFQDGGVVAHASYCR